MRRPERRRAARARPAAAASLRPSGSAWSAPPRRRPSGGRRPGQAGGEHRLARPGWPVHEQVVPAGGGELERVPRHRLPADLAAGPGRRAGRRGDHDRLDRGHGSSPSRQPITSAGCAPGAPPGRPRGWPRPRSAAGSTSGPGPSASVRHTVPGTGRREPSSPSSPTKDRSPTASWVTAPTATSRADGDGEVEARARPCGSSGGARLTVMRCGGHWHPARHQGGAYAARRFTAGGVGQADDGERRQPGADVDLDGDGVAVDAEDGGGGDEAEHEPLLVRCRGRAASRSGGPCRAPASRRRVRD